MAAVYPLSGVGAVVSLQRALRESRPDVVIPCDPGVRALLHAVYRADPSLRRLIERSLGPSESLTLAESRFDFLNKAIEWGIRVPTTLRIASTDNLKKWRQEVAPTAVLKVDGESGGNGVRIARSHDDSFAAWQAFYASHHDILANDSKLLKELLKNSWPQRHWLVVFITRYSRWVSPRP